MQRSRLQPLTRFAFLALGLHGLAAAGVLAWWRQVDHGSAQPSQGQALTWHSPADFTPGQPLPPTAAKVVAKTEAKPPPVQEPARATAPPEPAPRAIAIDPKKAQALMEARPEQHASEPPAATASDVSRFITVTKRDTSPAPAPGTFVAPEDPDNLEGAAPLDQARVRLDEVDRAIINAFRRHWNPPPANTLSLDQRTAHMDVTVDRTGHVLNFKLARRSGNDDFDYSVIEAAHRLDKIDVQLPASYPQDHYEFQVHFHVE